MTRAELLAECAAVLEDVRPDLARKLRAFNPGGRHRVRDDDGFSPRDFAKAQMWIEMHDRAANAADARTVVVGFAKESGGDVEKLWRLFTLIGETRTRKILRRWGRI